ncbi:MAG TPA: hypothetical protein VFN57_15270 [Thermomicrobiaceae bacterium]|nr:hypothetical protein [Thermomicrobiaceae bacterium]
MVRLGTVVGVVLVALALSACGSVATSPAGSSGAAPTGTPVAAAPALTPTVASPAPSPAATPAQPTPDALGSYAALTFRQARLLAPFHLARPAWLPPYLVDRGIQVQGPPPGVHGPIQFATLYYGAAVTRQRDGLQIIEHPGANGGSPPPGATPSTLTIAGHSVTGAAWTTNGVPILSLSWTDRGTSFTVLATMSAPLTEADVEHVIASMLAPAGAATPQP